MLSIVYGICMHYNYMNIPFISFWTAFEIMKYSDASSRSWNMIECLNHSCRSSVDLATLDMLKW